MKSSTKRILSILTAVLMIVASLFIYSSLIRPVHSEIKDLRTETNSRLDVINKNKTSIAQVQKLLSEYQNIAKAQEVIFSIVPLEENIPLIINQIFGLVDINRLSIESVTIKKLAIKPSVRQKFVKGVGTLRFDLRLAGNYENFKMFIQNMETNANLLDLNDLKIETDAKTKLGGENFLYTMNIDSYYQTQ